MHKLHLCCRGMAHSLSLRGQTLYRAFHRPSCRIADGFSIAHRDNPLGDLCALEDAIYGCVFCVSQLGGFCASRGSDTESQGICIAPILGSGSVPQLWIEAPQALWADAVRSGFRECLGSSLVDIQPDILGQIQALAGSNRSTAWHIAPTMSTSKSHGSVHSPQPLHAVGFTGSPA